MIDNRLAFLLGGQDLEMVTIRDLLVQKVPDRFYDKKLLWGAKASDYSQEIETCLKHGRVPVLLELKIDLDLDRDSVIVVDHHGKRAGSNQPTALHQVFELLKLPAEKWSRWYELVAANDRGYIPALVEAGASQEEIVKVRSADREAQGITLQDEEAAVQALAETTEVIAHGNLTVVRLSHNRTACVSDRLQPELGGTGFINLLIISPGEVNFFGKGSIIYELDKSFSGGWFGGALPERGFWGHNKVLEKEVLLYLEEKLEKSY